MKKFVKILMLMTFVAVLMTVSAKAEWIKTNDSWSYIQNGAYFENGWKKVDSTWYYFKDRIMQTGWVYDKAWYYLNPDGSMKTSWLLDGGEWYYLNSDGSMKKGWLKQSGDWYFLNDSGVMQNSIIQVDGINYDMGNDGKMKAENTVGYPYNAFNRDGTVAEMILPKKNGEVTTVNLWQGMSIELMAKRLNEKGVCRYEDFVKAVNEKYPDFKYESYISDGTFYRYEGYLFPDIYEFYLYEDAKTVVKKLLKNFEKRITEDFVKEIEAQGKTLNEVLTLASIVQGEAPDKANMQKVAKVFLNRLDNSKVFPKLQANPTSNYANDVIMAFNPTLANKYDTYKTDGLMPGPINNPGIMAIEAVLYPDNSIDDYFFCTDKVTKEFYYAKTWEEHKLNTIKAGLRDPE